MVTLSPTDRVIQMLQRLHQEGTINKLVEENQHQKSKNSLTGRVERKKLLAQQARHTIVMGNLWQFWIWFTKVLKNPSCISTPGQWYTESCYLPRWLDGTSAQPSIFKQELLPLPQKPARGKLDEQLTTIEIPKDASNVFHVVLCICVMLLCE